ncbi:MAG: transcriptional repressor [Deltaproteobacteria bacterium]|jgi:Fur family ferric uptake transcriptional regulator|nr:transcriptional repressor [Deltaproteobacteria bacterium]
MTSYQEQFRRYLEERGLKVTRQRLGVAGALQAMPGHHSIDALRDRLREAEPGIGQATVYRTLRLLGEAGLAVELRLGAGASRFEAVQAGCQPHYHLVCRNCGAMVELQGGLPELRRDLAAHYGFSLEGQDNCLFGFCAHCAGIS